MPFAFEIDFSRKLTATRCPKVGNSSEYGKSRLFGSQIQSFQDRFGYQIDYECKDLLPGIDESYYE